MRVPQPLLLGILGMKLPSFPTKGQLVFHHFSHCSSVWEKKLLTVCQSGVCLASPRRGKAHSCSGTTRSCTLPQTGVGKSSILIGVSIINHPFWDTPIFGNIHIPYWSDTSDLQDMQAEKPDDLARELH